MLAGSELYWLLLSYISWYWVTLPDAMFATSSRPADVRYLLHQ